MDRARPASSPAPGPARSHARRRGAAGSAPGAGARQTSAPRGNTACRPGRRAPRQDGNAWAPGGRVPAGNRYPAARLRAVRAEGPREAGHVQAPLSACAERADAPTLRGGGERPHRRACSGSGRQGAPAPMVLARTGRSAHSARLMVRRSGNAQSRAAESATRPVRRPLRPALASRGARPESQPRSRSQSLACPRLPAPPAAC